MKTFMTLATMTAMTLGMTGCISVTDSSGAHMEGNKKTQYFSHSVMITSAEDQNTAATRCLDFVEASAQKVVGNAFKIVSQKSDINDNKKVDCSIKVISL